MRNRTHIQIIYVGDYAIREMNNSLFSIVLLYIKQEIMQNKLNHEKLLYDMRLVRVDNNYDDVAEWGYIFFVCLLPKVSFRYVLEVTVDSLIPRRLTSLIRRLTIW